MELAERDRGFAWARYLAARAYVEAHDPIHAEAALRRGLALQPDSPVPSQRPDAMRLLRETVASVHAGAAPERR